MTAPPTTEPSSYEVAEAAQERLRSVSYPSVRRLNCNCDNRGVLYLQGRLSSYYQKQLAQEAVSDLPGTTRIINEVEVVGDVLGSSTVA